MPYIKNSYFFRQQKNALENLFSKAFTSKLLNFAYIVIKNKKRPRDFPESVRFLID